MSLKGIRLKKIILKKEVVDRSHKRKREKTDQIKKIKEEIDYDHDWSRFPFFFIDPAGGSSFIFINFSFLTFSHLLFSFIFGKC